MFMTNLHARWSALVGICSLALASCASTTLGTSVGHSAHPGAIAPVEVALMGAPHTDEHAHHHGVEHGHEVNREDMPALDAAAEQSAQEMAVKGWTCPMHPEVVRDEPGNCPVCGMKLVEQDAKSPPRGQP